MTDIYKRINKHYEAAVAHYGEDAVFGVMHYGSWNYKTNLPDSDVDTKCILIPDLYHLAIKPYEVKHLHIDDEVCECMSIMHMVENWKKQNINFVEIMFTPYFKVNPKYSEFWDAEGILSEDWAERIARYDMNKAVLSMSYQALNTLHQGPEDLKKIMNAVRISNSLTRLIDEKRPPYTKVIRMDSAVAGIRTGETPIAECVVPDLELFFNHMIEEAKNGAWLPDPEEKSKVDKFLEEYVLKLIEYRIGH